MNLKRRKPPVQATDRETFEEQFAALCAGFNVPCTLPRRHAYFLGLAKMSIEQFARVVERCLADNGPEEMPTVNVLWKLHKAPRAAPVSPPAAPAVPDPEHIVYFANRLLFMHLRMRGGLVSTGEFAAAHGMKNCATSDELERCLAFKRALVAEFMGYVNEGEELATPAEFIRRWGLGLQRVSEVSAEEVRALAQIAIGPECAVPFPAFMARPIDSQRQVPAGFRGIA